MWTDVQYGISETVSMITVDLPEGDAEETPEV